MGTSRGHAPLVPGDRRGTPVLVTGRLEVRAPVLERGVDRLEIFALRGFLDSVALGAVHRLEAFGPGFEGLLRDNRVIQTAVGAFNPSVQSIGPMFRPARQALWMARSQHHRECGIAVEAVGRLRRRAWQ